MIKAIIDPEWATNINPMDTWRNNKFSAESIHEDVNLAMLGGLAIDLSNPRIADQATITNAASTRHIIDLSAAQPAIETSTQRLLDASTVTYGKDHELTVQLMLRNLPNRDHGSNEPWFLPLCGVKIVDVRKFAEI